MRKVEITRDCELRYIGAREYEPAATQIARIVADSYAKNRVGQAGREWAGLPPIQIQITDKGAIEILHRDDESYTTGMGIVAGTLMGIGIARNKRPVLDRKGVESGCMSPACAAVRFASFADLVECANALTREQGEKIDVSTLPRAVPH